MADRWIRLARVEDVPPGKARFVSIEDRELAVYHFTGPDRFAVSQNSCPHAGGNLAAGEIEGSVVTCPWHYWSFDVEAGVCTHSDAVRLRTYPARVSEGWIETLLPES